MFQALINIFAVFGVGCFLAGVACALSVLFVYLELKKEPEQPPAQQREREKERKQDEWLAYFSKEFDHLL